MSNQPCLSHYQTHILTKSQSLSCIDPNIKSIQLGGNYRNNYFQIVLDLYYTVLSPQQMRILIISYTDH
jgi:hypothetical protein